MHKDINDLIPDWFSLDMYAIKKDFDLFDYFINLMERYQATHWPFFTDGFSNELKNFDSHAKLGWDKSPVNF